MALLEVKDLRTSFHLRTGVYRAVNGVSFSLEKGKTLGIVGESGSGKSVTVMSLMGLIPKPPGRIEGGEAIFDGQDLLKLNESQLRKIRGNRIAMIFQDPMTCLNPYLRVSKQLCEVLVEHAGVSWTEAKKEAIRVLDQVGIPEARKRVDQYPHEFSGGMRQRVMIAMALISKPEILIADEPTTALDVTIQAQILDLLRDLQKETGMALILITHDLGVVSGMSDDILVMYAGRPVERGNVDEIFYDHKHPYTYGLLKSIPRVDGAEQDLYTIPGLPPDPSKLPEGCPFASRCEFVLDKCRHGQIPVQTGKRKSHQSFCHLQEIP